MTALLTWFRGRSVREQRLLVVMAALFVITLVFAGIVRPVRDGLESTRQRHASAEVRLGEVKAQVAQVKAIQRGRPRTPEGALADAVRARADESGFVLANLEPDGDRIRIGIATARPGPLLSWIAGLEADGLLVDASTITGNGDGTVAATLTLKGRAP
ncbi:type II secretion system protein GspM [Sphingomonas sp. CCH5-D11]|uniref:type II secretion system protein GspM n=1 Tax=Sphingomonas sp. CCH5-D11 TaxID=1768786 RepID=UPI00082CBD85|nr:type II secretion system protein GspM [Sphingomonas sp. CCH5-D11]